MIHVLMRRSIIHYFRIMGIVGDKQKKTLKYRLLKRMSIQWER